MFQSFTKRSRHSLLVNEHIERFGGFDGFFTQGNVVELTGATGRQFSDTTQPGFPYNRFR